MANQDQLRLQEQQRRKLNVATCLAVVERPADKGGKFTHLSVRLPEVLMPLLGKNMFNPELMKKNRDNLSMGLIVMGKWLNINGYGGFSVSDTAGNAIVDSGIALNRVEMSAASLYISEQEKAGGKIAKLPSKAKFMEYVGDDATVQAELTQFLREFSAVVGQAVEVFSPKQVVALLFHDSTLPDNLENKGTSKTAKKMIEVASGGNLAQVNAVLKSWL